ncbi:class I SAM-dependent methyltransferase [Actinopolymorpha alba]|uniref:class I SAM-dependent methyltransferase n=1 Tax=Actinopolymorpha alba TaxID=533267 RepID=UPI00036E5355|nr:methyltransferase domain-containing protein [Actinopolymorpha alba]
MKANTNRSGRLTFDRVVDDYDTGRPDLPAPLVADIVRSIALPAGSRVLEVGAATGQLTRALRAARMRVVALEPGQHLRHRLAERFGADDGIDILPDFFEEYAGAEGSFGAVWSANAFHWVDPAVSYRKAAELMEPAGHLVLIWAYPILTRDLQLRLNETALANNPNSAWDPDTYEDYINGVTAAGREELAGCGCFEAARHWWMTEPLSFDVDTYIAFLTSYGHNAALDETGRQQLASDVRAALAGLGADRLEGTNHIYTCVARARTA